MIFKSSTLSGIGERGFAVSRRDGVKQKGIEGEVKTLRRKGVSLRRGVLTFFHSAQWTRRSVGGLKPVVLG